MKVSPFELDLLFARDRSVLVLMKNDARNLWRLRSKRGLGY